ncbi:MAG: prolipoprotein diacylglyceryl transferase [Bacteroidia bacterium]|nr:prolipoprotein diacylglyceryl transferase [Bacteroidia bacterium]MBT8229930.1 prolipoprotein diacylglyceryl transferase [Bacteroidia bacterium]NNK90626.1 prolipoprotein diacylglyceryl transferase [Saprospiraceae bacterium]
MYPDLSYLFHDLFGTEVDNWTSIFKTFGIFLTLAFTGAYFILKSEFIRMENAGMLDNIKIKNPEKLNSPVKEGLINALFGFFLGFKVPFIINHFDDFKLDPAGIIFSRSGNLMVGLFIAVLFGLYYYFSASNRPPIEKEANLYVKPSQKVFDIVMISAISGIIGSRLFSILENLDAFFQDPFGQIFSGSGLTIYGGLILAFITVYYYVKKFGLKPIHVMDAAAPSILIGYAIGRMGCQFSGDGDWGIVNTAEKPSWFIFPDWMWSYDYPRNVADFYQRGPKIPDCIGNFCTHLDPPVFPTPIYEIISSFILLAFIWSIRKKIKTPGLLFFIYLFLSAIARFSVEIIRVNPRYELFGMELSMAQGISALLVIVGLIGIIKLSSSGKKPDYTIPGMENFENKT